MEALAPYQTTAPTAPENLNLELAEWLELLGFEVELLPYHHQDAAYLMGTWGQGEGPRFHLEYVWGRQHPGHATCTLWVDSGHVTTKLFTQLAHTLGAAQQQLLGDPRFRCALVKVRHDIDLPF